MAGRHIFLISLLVLFSKVESASYYDIIYENVTSIAPTVMSIFDCISEKDAWGCAKTKASNILDSWSEEIKKQRDAWREQADAEVLTSGRSMGEPPSKLGGEIEDSINSIAVLMQNGIARALTGKKHDGGGIDSITISAANEGHKKKMKKKKQKPPKIHLIHPVVMKMHKTQKMPEKGRSLASGKLQSWVIGHEEVRNLDPTSDINRDQNANSTPIVSGRSGKGLTGDLWSLGEKALDEVADYAINHDNKENGVADKSTLAEQRGKKKKKKKAILKLLILGAVLKAKIGTLLQILSFKLQVKFFLIALIGLGLNLARLWLDLKKQHAQPQKVIYYENAQHQHHYEQEEEPGWGPWSRSLDPESQETDVQLDLDLNSPYRRQERRGQSYFANKA